MKTDPKNLIHILAPIFVAATLGQGCGSNKSSSDDGDGEDSSNPVANGGVTTSINGVSSFTSAYPSGLALSFFPTTTKGASLSLTNDQATEGAAAGQPLKQKKEEAEKRLKGEGDCLPPGLAKRPPMEGTETCYEFDQDMIYGTRDGTNYSGTLNGKNAKGEACLPAFARTRIDFVADMVDRATGMIQAMFCQSRKADKTLELPLPGKGVDMLAALKSAMGDKATRISKAKMSREGTNDSSGNPIYVSEVEMVDMNGSTRAIALVHTPKPNGDYEGTLINGVSGGINNPQDANKSHFISVAYSKTTDNNGKDTIRYELRSARFHGDIDDIYDDKGQLDFNANADLSGANTNQNYGRYKKSDGTYFNQANEAVSGMTYVVASVNPDDNTGTFLYAQNPGGNYNEAARGLVASLSTDSSGNFGGCAVSGAVFSGAGQGVSIRQALNTGATLDPTGFYHPFLNTTGNAQVTNGSDNKGYFYSKIASIGSQTVTSTWYRPDTTTTADATTFVTAQTGNFVTRQCFNLRDGKYVLDTAEIPDNSGYQLVRTDTSSPQVIKAPKPVDGVKPPTAPSQPKAP